MAATIRIIIQSQGGSDLDDLGERARRQGGGFSALKEIGIGALRSIGTAAVDLAANGLAAIGGFVKDSIGLAGDFQGNMNLFGAAVGKGFEPGSEALGEFQDLFLDLGKKLPVSTMEVQEAATALVKGGLDPAVIKAGALESALNFAAAAGMELADAAELTIKQLGTFVPIGASVEEQTLFMANAQDLLVKAAGASTLDVDKLGDAMLQAGGAAKATGVDYKDFVTTMGLISPAFSSAAEAGTSYKNFLARIIPTTEPATDAMIALGLATEDGTSKFFDASGAFIGNQAAAELLKTSLSGLSDIERGEALMTIFGNDAKNAAIALMEAGSAGYDAFSQKMDAANGVTAQAAAVNQGFNFSMENLKGSLEALQITIGTALLPVLTPLVDKIAVGVGVVMDFASAVFSANDPIAALTGGMLTNSEASGALSAVIALLSGTWQNLETIVNTVVNVIQGIVTVVFGAIQGFLVEHGAEIRAAFQAAWKTIQQIVTTITQIIQATIGRWGDTINSDVTGNTNALKTIISGAWTVISSLIQGALTIIQGILTVALGAITGDWGTAWEGIKTIAQGVWDGIKGVVMGALEIIAGAMGTNMAEISATWNRIITDMGNAIGPFVDRVSRGFNVIVDAVKSAIDWIKRVADTLGSIDIPDWLEGHSPPPMAEWLASIGGAAEYAGAALTTVQPGGVSNRNMTYNQQRSISITQNYRGIAPTTGYNAALVRSLAGV